MKKVSLIMPVHNKVNYIKKSISSVLYQTYTDFELLIIDDGSLDGSGLICDHFARKDCRVRVYHIKNSGVSNARNIGIENSTGKYLCFMDADDYLDNTYLEDMIGIIDQKDVDLVLSGLKKVNAAEELLTEILPMLNGTKNKAEFLKDFSYEQAKTGIYGYVSNKFVKTNVIKENAIKFDSNVKLAEDYLFWINVYKVINKIYFCDKSYYNYLQEAENSSTGTEVSVDYYVQLMINVQVKELLKSNKAYIGNNKKWIDYQISKYIYCFAFHQKLEKYQEYKIQINKVLNQTDIVESISFFNQSNLNKVVLTLIKMNWTLGLFNFLKTRELIRRKYRSFGGKDERGIQKV